MKKLLAFILLGLVAGFADLYAQNNAIDKIFTKYSNAEGFETVIINQDMFNMMKSMSDDDNNNDKNVKSLINKIDFVKILTYKPKTGIAIKIDLYGEVIAATEGKGFKDLMSVNEEDSRVKFLVKNNDKGRIEEFLMVTAEDDETTVIWIKGDIDLSMLSKLTKGGFNFDGIDKPKKKHK